MVGLQHQVAAGETVKPWLALGPFYEDLSAAIPGPSLFEAEGPEHGLGADVVDEIVEQAWELLTGGPREGDTASFRGQQQSWDLARRPEPFLSWGEYFVANHLCAVFGSTLLRPGQPGVRRFRLSTRVASRVLVSVSGTVVLDTQLRSLQRLDEQRDFYFEAPLDADENVVNVVMVRIARGSRVGFRLVALDDDLTASVSLSANESTRAGIEKELRGISIPRDLYQPAEDVVVRVRHRRTPDTRLTVGLEGPDGVVARTSEAEGNGDVKLCAAADLPDGSYEVVCRWEAPDGRPLTSATFPLRTITPIAAAPEFEDRRRQFLEEAASQTSYPEDVRGLIWREVARYALGRYDTVDEHSLRRICGEHIAVRRDCADFDIQGVLRLMYWERAERRLSPEINALLKDTILGFKYWVDEPGDTVMVMGSENHRLLFHVAEWMAGQLYPTEEFVNSRQRGLYHATKGRFYFAEWLRQRGQFGFDEWHSNSYLPIDIAPLVNIYDFALKDDRKVPLMAQSVLDYIHLILAADTLHGIFGTTHGRSYTRNLKNPELEGTSATCWLLYGTGTLTAETSSNIAAVSIATSSYRVPEILQRIATDRSTVVRSRQRQGTLRGRKRSADFCVYRTPDYMLSGLQDHRKGEFDTQAHAAQVTFPSRAVIFWSCPHTTEEGSGLRPDYWSGNTCLPRVVQQDNVLSLSWRLTNQAWMTHCFFEPDRFDEVRFHDNWAFARVDKGYVGIYSQRGFVRSDVGRYAGRELVCYAPDNSWLVECGRQADWTSFDAFVDGLSAATVEAADESLAYESPSIGTFVTGWDVQPTVAGRPLELSHYPMVDSDWAFSAFGSSELSIRYGDEAYDVVFV